MCSGTATRSSRAEPAGEDAATTLDVFDEQLARAGGELVRGRLRLVDRLAPAVTEAYGHLAGRAAVIEGRYEAEWAGADGGPADLDPTEADARLHQALAELRSREIDRGVTLAGPHRDEWRLTLDGLDTRTHASQGEQRSLALALRLAGHRVATETLDAAPVLLLDDVFSELDQQRAVALGARAPRGPDAREHGERAAGRGASRPPPARRRRRDRVRALGLHVTPPRRSNRREPGRASGRDSRRRLSRPVIPGELSEPVSIGDAAALVGNELGLAEPLSFTRLIDAWSDIVGDAIAQHSRPRGVRNGVLEIVVDAPAWATQLRYLEADLVERASQLVGPGVVSAVRISVDPGPSDAVPEAPEHA